MEIKKNAWIVLGLAVVAFLGFFSFFSFENEEERVELIASAWNPDLNRTHLNIGPSSEIINYITPSDFQLSNNSNIKYIQGKNASHLEENQILEILIDIPVAGYYQISFDYLTNSLNMVQPNLLLTVNEQDTRRINVPIHWRDSTHDFETNRHGHELIPSQNQINNWFHTYARDAVDWHLQPLTFFFESGSNKITFETDSYEVYLGTVYITKPSVVKTYAELVRGPQSLASHSNLALTRGEHPSKKSSSFIRQLSFSTPDVFPYSSSAQYLNAFGDNSWRTNGQSVTWELNILESGYYYLTFQILQDILGASVFRTVLINGEVPFEELIAYPFEYGRRFSNHTLSGDDQSPFLFYLKEGINEITLIVDDSPIMLVVELLQSVRIGIRDVSLDIRQLTGGRVDPNRDWDISEFFPNIDRTFYEWIYNLTKAKKHLENIFPQSRVSSFELEIQLVIEALERLAENPNELPARTNELSEGATSAAQMIGQLEQNLRLQPLTIATIYAHGADVVLPAPNATLARRINSQLSQFWASFSLNNDTRNEDVILDVWVGRSQFHVELLQNITDSLFTPETGINVRFSVMPNEQKLILANAAGHQPDVAMGVGNWLPFQMAVRGAATDLSQKAGFNEMLGNYSPGAFLPLMIDGGLFGFPETQDFYVLFYRDDMLSQLNIPVPNTWNDVVSILPELQRQGLNFFAPLSGPSASKPFMFTAPFFYQFGGDVHSPDALSTGINSPESLLAMRFMTDLFMVYSLPLQVANFYNDFRYGALPIGISNFETYLQLTVAAPEIAGAWNIALHPGIENSNGEISRYATGSAASAMILSASDKQDEAWQFLQWWLSTETQVTYSNQLMTLFGPEFIWNSANLEAFAQLPIPRAHRDVILNQWDYLLEVPLTPASYIIEREISNTWNRVVFDGQNLRGATDAAVLRINREIRRRMIEFGYIDNEGNIIKPYILPTINIVKEWIVNGD